MYVHVRTRDRTRVYLAVRTYAYVYVRTYVYVYMYTRTTYMRAHVCTCMHACTPSTHTEKGILIRTYVYVQITADLYVRRLILDPDFDRFIVHVHIHD